MSVPNNLIKTARYCPAMTNTGSRTVTQYTGHYHYLIWWKLILKVAHITPIYREDTMVRLQTEGWLADGAWEVKAD